MTRIAITGALGRMGTLVIQEAARIEGMELVAGLDAVGAGKPLQGGVLVKDASQLEQVLKETRPDVLIDFTIAKAAVKNVCIAASLGVDLVVGTTGISSEQHSEMREAIEGNVAAVITPNFSVGVNLFWKLVADAEPSARAASSSSWRPACRCSSQSLGCSQPAIWGKMSANGATDCSSTPASSARVSSVRLLRALCRAVWVLLRPCVCTSAWKSASAAGSCSTAW